MSLIVTKAAKAQSRSRGNARLVLLELADHANQEAVKRGEAARAWPSQNTLARNCNCSRSTVAVALAELVELGDIVDSGLRGPKGEVKWDLTADLSEFRTGGAPGVSGSRADLSDSRTKPVRTFGHEPVVKPEKNQGFPSGFEKTFSLPANEQQLRQRVEEAAEALEDLEAEAEDTTRRRAVEPLIEAARPRVMELRAALAKQKAEERSAA